jgi:hypothetical protein
LFGVVHLLRIRSVSLAAWGGNSYRQTDGALAARPLAKGAGEFGAAQVQLLRRGGVPRLNNQPTAFNGNEVADGGQMWRYLAE